MAKEDLKPLGSGKLTPEEEREIRIKGAKALQKKRERARTASELFAAALDAKVTDRELKRRIKAAGFEQFTEDIALVLAVLDNVKRKGMVDDAQAAFDAAGRTEGATDEAAHAAFLQALTASGGDQDGERDTRQGDEVPDTPTPEK